MCEVMVYKSGVKHTILKDKKIIEKKTSAGTIQCVEYLHRMFPVKIADLEMPDFIETEVAIFI
jgi:CxxC motif-containing protein